MIVRKGSGMGSLVPAGAPLFRRQAPLVPTIIGTVDGIEKLGGQFGVSARPRGVGALVPVKFPVIVPGARRSFPIPSPRGFRGLGATINYCSNNPPDSATAAIIAGRGDSIALISCGGTTVAPNQPTPTIGTAPVYQPPTGIEDCVALGLATSAGMDCVARNTARAVGAENQHLTDNQNYQTQLCILNGGGGYVPAGADVGAWCAGQYGGSVPASYVPGSVQAQVSGPVVPAYVAPAPSYRPVARFSSSRGNALQVGDQWSISISGGAPNAPVVVTGTQNGATSTNSMGTTDASGSFSKTGTATADTIGQWSETWTVGGVNAGSFSFSVAAAPGSNVPANTGSAPPSGDTSGGTSGTFDVGALLGESVFMGIPNWILLAAVGGILLLGRK